MLGSIPPIPTIVAIAFVIFLGIGLHEYAHCKFADMAGDPTPRFYGRVTLDLTKHFEPMGTLMMVLSSLTGFGIGWGKPAPINPAKMRNPRWDAFAATLAGPVSNLVQALIYGTILRLLLAKGVISPDQVFGTFNHEKVSILVALLSMGVLLNLSLFSFNLVPLGPLDGHWIFGYLLPERWQLHWFKFNRTVGGPLLIGIILFSQYTKVPILGRVIFPILSKLFNLITGLQF